MEQYVSASPDPSLIMSYLYRLDPVIDQKRLDPNQDSNIDKVEGAIDLRWLTAKHQNGKYQIIMTDTSRPRGKQRVGEAIVQVCEPDLVPLCDPRTVVWSDPKNATYIAQLQSRNMLPPGVMGGNIPAAAAPVAPVAAAAPAAASAAAGGGAYSPIQQAREMMNLVKELQGEAPAISEARLMPIVEQLTENNLKLLERLQNAQPAAAVAPKSLVEQIREVRELNEVIGGGSAAAPAPESILQQAGVVFSALASLASTLFPHGLPWMAPAEAPAAAAGAAGAVAGSSVASAGAAGAVAANAISNDEGDVMFQVMSRIVPAAFAAFAGGAAGAAFAAEHHKSSEAARADLEAVRAAGLAKVLGYLVYVPNLEKLLQDAGRTRADLDDFIIEIVRFDPAAAVPAAKKRGGK